MAKTTEDIAPKFADQLFPGEAIRDAFGGAVCKFDSSSGLSAYVAITDRRLLVVQKGALFGKKALGVELSQIVEFVASGALLPKLTLGTTGGQRVQFTTIPKDKIQIIQAAIGAARG